jgi:tRNA A37 threonylcarbamoyladenosine modification protein TsaB
VQFILNTAIDPHFCALFDDESSLIEIKSWITRHQDSEETWSFFKKHNFDSHSFSLIGGISGPGGFSSLRVAAGILNALGLAKNQSIYQVRADAWISSILKENKENPEAFCLNSFGDGVFYREERTKKLIRATAKKESQKWQNTPCFVGLLSPEKQTLFPQKIEIDLKNQELLLLKILQKTKPQENFISEYEVPPVQKN